ncbi:o-methyltransferase [Aspergillus saccharolyticus JOP 1030-1]|uniref:O-methyltransferase n=1 Tax=Aspergillus saccharolyticus JOP 1030-1 TaxID=1450539 RepID=A0A318ZBG0_9EURO|nr:o-methyltransferase [Aspergillus saccharolyticus JOP 1030-1]PYH44716.1 o-methyltransferase [Aspergillus saccharolyticus JOP 1030-1]
MTGPEEETVNGHDNGHIRKPSQEAFVDSNVAIAPNDPEEVPALLKRISLHGEAYLTENDELERTRILDSARALVYALETPREAMIRHCWSQSTLYAAIEIAVNLDLFTALSRDETPKSAAELALATGSNPGVLARILKHLTAMGVIKETGPDEYRRTGFSIAMQSPRYSDAYPCMTGCITAGVLALPAQLKATNYAPPVDSTACAFQRGFDTELHFFDLLKQHPQHAREFNNHMSAYHQGRPSWMDLGFYPVHTLVEVSPPVTADDVLLVDIGGGMGHDLVEFHRKWPDLSGRLIVQDLPAVVAQARELNLNPKIELMEYDFFEEQVIKGARAYYLHSVLHDWPDTSCRLILQHLVPALRKGYSKLLINENVIPSTNAYWETTSLDLIMMADFASTERTEAQWRALVESVDGLRIVKIWTARRGVESLIECEVF